MRQDETGYGTYSIALCSTDFNGLLVVGVGWVWIGYGGAGGGCGA